MITLSAQTLLTPADAQARLQTAIGVEFGTLPVYLYALYSIASGKNPEAVSRIHAVVLQEMIHLCLACNILNALGGDPVLTAPDYPGPLPGDIGPPGGQPLQLHLLPFSKDAMIQAMAIEEPEDPLIFPQNLVLAPGAAPTTQTIGQFYAALDTFLATLPASAWTPNRHQIEDNQFFQGRLYPVNGYQDAHRAIGDIVSEGEGTTKSPLDFLQDVAHYYRFEEILKNQVLTKDANPTGFRWTGTLGVDWTAVAPAIPDPGLHDFTTETAPARAAQTACNQAYTRMIDELQSALTGGQGHLGNAVAAMFKLRAEARTAFQTPLADPTKVAGPAFLYQGA